MKSVILSIIFLLLASVKTAAQKLDEVRWQVDNLISSFPGVVGVSMVSDLGDTIHINENHHFPLMSVVKFHQALAVYNKCKEHEIMLDKRIRVRRRDMMKKTWSPMRDKNPRGGNYTIEKLLKLSLVESDNNACNILSDKFVTMKEVNDFVHSVGIMDCCISASERHMATETNACYGNWSTPKTATELLEWFFDNQASYKFVWDTMKGCKTGTNRLPRYLEDVIIVHKTGTGPTLPDGKIMAVNDAACIILPNNHHYNIAVFIENAACDLEKCEDLIANISRLCFNHMIKH